MCQICSHTLRQRHGASLNSMRADIFKRKIAGKCHGPPKLSSLPPTMAAFRLHCQRVHFIKALWKATGMPSSPDLDPLQCGWEMNGSELQPVFTPPVTGFGGPSWIFLFLQKCSTFHNWHLSDSNSAQKNWSRKH